MVHTPFMRIPCSPFIIPLKGFLTSAQARSSKMNSSLVLEGLPKRSLSLSVDPISRCQRRISACLEVLGLKGLEGRKGRSWHRPLVNTVNLNCIQQGVTSHLAIEQFQVREVPFLGASAFREEKSNERSVRVGSRHHRCASK